MIGLRLITLKNMPNKIIVKYKIPDARSKAKKSQFESLGFEGKIKSVHLVESYTIDAETSQVEIKQVAEALANPLLEESFVNDEHAPKRFDWAIEIGFLPGVTDNVGNTTKETIEDLLKRKFAAGEGVYTSLIYFIEAKLTESEIKRIADSLYNPLIQRATLKNTGQYKNDGGIGMTAPRVLLNANMEVSEVDLNISDKELDLLGRQGIKNPDNTRRGPLALDLESLNEIKKYFAKAKRNPTDIELESIAQTWSEHCKHTIFANPIDEIKDGLYKAYIKKATQDIRKKKGKNDFCLSVFHDNSGAIDFDDKYLITHKAETHNSPSALDPFGGAITGIVGVNRDAIGFGLGAKPIINTYGFCLADPNDKRALYRDSEKKQKMLPPRRIMDGVIQGVNVGGNCSGIPTAQGFLCFDDRFRGKPLVFVGTVGLMPKKHNGRILYEKKAEPGDYIVVTGGRVGQDGIHGATFSSVAMDSGSPATAVQIGDPITQKKMSDAIIKEARDKKLYSSITDDGAGGISCSIAEMAKESGGCSVDLEKVPLKYPGLEPWKIWISESQERMTLSVPKDKWPAFKKLMDKRGVEASQIGEFNKSGKCVVKYNDQVIMDIEMDFLHDGLPTKNIKTKKFQQVHGEPTTKKENWNEVTKKMLARLNIASYDFISKQYDHEVQGGSVIKPIQGRGRVNAETAVIRPVLDSKKGVILSYGINPTYSDLDTYHMAACAIDSAIRAAVSAGADIEKLAILDNFCWCSSTQPERLYQLKQAVSACYDYATAYSTPFISGKDSMFNDFRGYDDKGAQVEIAIPPTLLISAIGVIPDIYRSISIDPKFAGDLVYLLGETKDELGGSEYFSMISEEKKKDLIGNNVPKVDALKNRAMYTDFYKATTEALISSAISVGRGGLIVAFAKMAMAGGLGLDLSFQEEAHVALFSESQGRMLVTIDPKNRERFEKMMAKNAISLIGKVAPSKKIVITNKADEEIVNLELNSISESYKSTFKNY